MKNQQILILDDGWKILDEQSENIPRYIALSLSDISSVIMLPDFDVRIQLNSGEILHNKFDCSNEFFRITKLWNEYLE
jgi:hypothetical protein